MMKNLGQPTQKKKVKKDKNNTFDISCFKKSRIKPRRPITNTDKFVVLLRQFSKEKAFLFFPKTFIQSEEITLYGHRD
jgi:hypothetical protein